MNNNPLPRKISYPWDRGGINALPRALPQATTTPTPAPPTEYSALANALANQYLSYTVPLSRNNQGNSHAVTTSASLLLKESYSRPVLVLNTVFQLGQGTGVGTAATAWAGTAIAAITTQATPISVAAYNLMHLFLTITAIAGTWDIYTQAKDAITGNWYDSQKVYDGLTATGHSGYACLGPVGIAEYLAFRFDPVAAGSLTATLSYLIKDSTGTGLVESIGVCYCGTGSSVNPISGYPILAGKDRVFLLEEGTELWAISDQSITVKTFLL